MSTAVSLAIENWVGIAAASSVALVYLGVSIGNGIKPSLLPLALKILAVALIGLVISGVSLRRESTNSNATIVLDISDSMNEAQAGELLQEARRLLPAAEVITPFAAKAGDAISGSANATYRYLKNKFGELDVGGSNLEAALNIGSIDGASLVLVSDGFETSGDARRAAAKLAGAGVRIFPLIPPIAHSDQNTFKVAQLYAPLVAQAQKSVEAKVSIVNSTSVTRRGLLEVTHDKKVILSKEIEVGAKAEALFSADTDPALEGIKEITATLSPVDKEFGPSSETVFLSGEVREKVLLFSGTSEDEKFLKESLQGQTYQVSSFVSSGRRIDKLPDLTEFSIVLLNNIPQDGLPIGSPIALQKYVKGGGAMIMIGGNKSFGLGGYKDSPIEEALPVKMQPPQTVKKRLNVAIELVLDKSQSMAANDKLQLTKEAARELIANLKDEDFIGVIGFDAVPFEVVELEQLRQSRENAVKNVGLLFPRGKTNLMPAMDEARRRLEHVSAGRKHMIVLTDGELPDGGPTYVELTKQLRLEGITLSTVMVGYEGTDELLRNMAEVGGGAFYRTGDPRSLPKIFVSDVKVSSGEETMKEASEFVVRRGPAGILSTKIESFPPVRGFVSTEAKDSSKTELVAFGDGRAEPLLVSWKYGLGHSLAFSSDANGRWSDYWVSWPRFGQFWTEIIDSLRADAGELDKNTKFDLRSSVERGTLNLDLSLFSSPGGALVSATLKLPDKSTQDVEFRESAKGRYFSKLDKVGAGDYEMQILVGSKKLTPVAFHLSGELFGERKGMGFNAMLLRELATLTGGKINPDKNDLSSHTTTKVEKVDITAWLLGLAALLLTIEILVRELGVRGLRGLLWVTGRA